MRGRHVRGARDDKGKDTITGHELQISDISNKDADAEGSNMGNLLPELGG